MFVREARALIRFYFDLSLAYGRAQARVKMDAVDLNHCNYYLIFL